MPQLSVITFTTVAPLVYVALPIRCADVRRAFRTCRFLPSRRVTPSLDRELNISSIGLRGGFDWLARITALTYGPWALSMGRVISRLHLCLVVLVLHRCLDVSNNFLAGSLGVLSNLTRLQSLSVARNNLYMLLLNDTMAAFSSLTYGTLIHFPVSSCCLIVVISPSVDCFRRGVTTVQDAEPQLQLAVWGR
jgi:hypothetical protein